MHTTNVYTIKNTLPTGLYWVLFPIEDLTHTVETVKRIGVGFSYCWLNLEE